MNLIRARIQCMLYEPDMELVGILHYVRCFLDRDELRAYLKRIGPKTLLRNMRYGRGLIVLGAAETWGEITIRNVAGETERVH